MKLSHTIVNSILLAVGVADGVLTQLDTQKLYNRMYQTTLRGARLRKYQFKYIQV